MHAMPTVKWPMVQCAEISGLTELNRTHSLDACADQYLNCYCNRSAPVLMCKDASTRKLHTFLHSPPTTVQSLGTPFHSSLRPWIYPPIYPYLKVFILDGINKESFLYQLGGRLTILTNGKFGVD